MFKFVRLHFFVFTLLFTFSLCAIQSAYAQGVELDENGRRLQALLEKGLDQQRDLIKIQGLTLKEDGALNIQQHDGYYAITLPHTTLVMPDNSEFEIGMVAINALPGDTKDTWKMTMALPTPMTLFSPDREPTFVVKIGAQRTSGVWDEGMLGFSKLDMNIQDINATAKNSAAVIHLDQIRLIQDFAKNAENLWSGPASAEMSGLSIMVPNPPSKTLTKAASFGKIAFNMKMFDYDPQAMVEYQEKIVEMTNATSPAEIDQAILNNAEDLFSSLFKAFGDGFLGQYEFKDIELHDPSGDNFETMKLGSAGFGFDMTGLKSSKANFDWRFSFAGFDMVPYPEDIPAVAPSRMNLDFSFKDIPVNEISEMGKGALSSTLQNPEMAQMAGLGLAMQLPDILAKAGSRIVLKNNYVENDVYKISIEGEGKPSTASPLKALADFTITITGLDETIQMIADEMQSKGGAQAAKAQQAMMGFTMIKGFADVQTINGKPAHVFHIQLTDQGQMLLNGNDMSALAGGALGGLPPQ